MYNGIAYRGSGCKADDNVCKVGSNQDGTEHVDKTPGAYNIYYSSKNSSIALLNLENVCFIHFTTLFPTSVWNQVIST